MKTQRQQNIETCKEEIKLLNNEIKYYKELLGILNDK